MASKIPNTKNNPRILQEIRQQPAAITRILRRHTAGTKIIFPELAKLERALKRAPKVWLVGSGSSYHSALLGKYLLEANAGLSAATETASEFHLRKPRLHAGELAIFLSQSGETADTYAALKLARAQKLITIALTNTIPSKIAAGAHAAISVQSGKEQSIPSTKVFSSEITTLILLSLYFAQIRKKLGGLNIQKTIKALGKIPVEMQNILDKDAEFREIGRRYAKSKGFFVLGRDFNMAIAKEGALKIKEMANLYAEGLPTGELKHGPITLVEKQFPAIFISPKDNLYLKNKSVLMEVKSNGGIIIALGSAGDSALKRLADKALLLPKTLPMLMPLLNVLALQMIAYHLGLTLGRNLDEPRHLAKAVTHE